MGDLGGEVYREIEKTFEQEPMIVKMQPDGGQYFVKVASCVLNVVTLV